MPHSISCAAGLSNCAAPRKIAAMPRSNLSLPHERRKAKLKGRELQLRVKIAENREGLKAVRTELAAMKPKPKPATE